jgi:hypothetical protein
MLVEVLDIPIVVHGVQPHMEAELVTQELALLIQVVADQANQQEDLLAVVALLFSVTNFKINE